MAPRMEQQLEKCLDEALKNQSRALEVFLQDESKEQVHSKCSKLFLSKLDKFMNRELDCRNIKNASLGFIILHRFGRSLILPGGQGLSVMVSQGLVKKMVQWFEKTWDLWVEERGKANVALFNLAEDLFDALMAVHESGKEGTYDVTESFLHLTGKLATDPQIHILVQKEAARKLNVILDKIPVELKKEKILSSREASDLINHLASRILEGGDFDLQIALLEALCRMTSRAQRREMAHHWFTMEFISAAFIKIQDSEFETDCRKFLNMVNGMQGDKRRVHSYPCLEVFLDKHELLMPSDEKLEDFWIDFNLGSQSISFYFSLINEKGQMDSQWEILCIPENEVQTYSVKEENNRKVLWVLLTEPLSLGGIEGSNLTIHFTSSLDILLVTQMVYGSIKNTKYVKSNRTSVVKTAVQILLDETGSQVLIPESQLSAQEILPYEALPAFEGPANTFLQTSTPSRKKVSESTTFISTTAGHRQSMKSESNITTPIHLSKAKVKPVLQMTSSSERKREFELRDLMATKWSCSISAVNESTDGQREQSSFTAVLTPHKDLNADLRKQYSKKFLRRMVQTDKGSREEHLDSSLNVVPDSQPAKKKKRSVSAGHQSSESSKRNLSLEESNSLTQLPTMAASKSVSKTVMCSVQQKCPSSTEHCSVDLSHKTLHAQLTQRLEAVLREREQASSLGYGRGKTTPRSVSKRISERPMPARPLPKQRPSAPVTSLDIKNDKKSENMTGSMIISSHYQHTTSTPATNRLLNKRSSHTIAENRESRASGFQKSCSMLKNAETNEDVYTFKRDTLKTNKIGGMDLDRSGIRCSEISTSYAYPSSTKKAPGLKAPRRNDKKYLFSDTDTDNATEHSWLKSSRRKPKPKVVDYSRQPNKPLPVAFSAYKFPDLQCLSPKAVKEQAKRKRPQKKPEELKDNPVPAVTNRLSQRPQRAVAKATKSYKDPSDISSQSEVEESPALKTKLKRAVVQTEESEKSSLEQDIKKKKISHMQETREKHAGSWVAKVASLCPSPSPVEIMRSSEKSTHSPASPTTPLRQLSLSPVGAPAVKMRRSFKGIRASSFYRPCVGKNSFNATPLASLTIDDKMTVTASKQPQHSLAEVLHDQPLLTSTAIERSLDALSHKSSDLRLELIDPEAVQCDQRTWSDGESPIAARTVRQSSPGKVKPLHEHERTPSSNRDCQSALWEFQSGPGFSWKRKISCSSSSSHSDCEEKENITPKEHIIKMKPRKLFRADKSEMEKEKNTGSKQADCDEAEEDERNLNEFKLKAGEGINKKIARQRLTRTSHHRRQDEDTCKKVVETVERESIMSHTGSSSCKATVEAEVDPSHPEISSTQEMGNICREFGAELSRKFQKRSERMELFTRHSVKAVQQHVSSIGIQIHQHRAQKLEHVKQVLTEELSNLEQDDFILQNMEKELMNYWKKQEVAFHSYHEAEARRLQRLKNTFNTDIFQNLEYEEEIFTSEMNVMKNDMKSIQEQFLQEMRDEELLTMRRALQALFLSEANSF
ncbi:synaptonemal complex protein 2 [Denticeps clupeoides]|uniref:synaptonemal complex protein 2 n=1 Tax=Denticeps clupeoides TaxID=299321 RepID=UPI0010A2FEC8|nr:synaptonemal complex protein 2-like [Denticeps clupeoides]